MKPDITQTIGEIVAKNYQTAGVFRSHGIDFCCGGGITLEAACKKNQLDPNELIQELEAADHRPGTAESYDSWPASLLIEYIVQTHHTYVKSKLDELSYYAEKVARVYGERYPENIVIRDAFHALAKEMRSHMAEEEDVVFPMILQKKVTAAQLAELESEHEAAGALMATIRQASNGFTTPEDACTTYRILYKNLEDFEADLHKHVHLENNILFKKAG